MSKPKIKPVHGWATVDGAEFIGDTFKINEKQARELYMYYKRYTDTNGPVRLVPMVMLTKAEFEALMEDKANG